MREAGYGGSAAADPDRLAVFAVKSLISMLDDADEVSVVRLNGASPLLIEPLGRNRARIEQQLDEIAEYGGGYTPCSSALDQVAELLTKAHQPGVAQVVMFLTDGRCTGPEGTERPDVEALLGSIASQKEGRFRFYLLRFKGRDVTPELSQLARRSAGKPFDVTSDDPTEILKPFADALTHSQGYAAQLLSSSQAELAGYGGARRVRLLAVAPGEGPELVFRIGGADGRPVSINLQSSRRGTYQHGNDGRVYRYVAADFRPSGKPLRLGVEGSEDWKLVAVPEYRLAVELQVQAGQCGVSQDDVGQSASVGSDLCLEARLVNERGEVISSAIGTRAVQAEARHRRQDQQDPPWLKFEPVGDEALFRLERANLEPGDHSFEVRISIPSEGGEGFVVGSRRAIQGVDRRIVPEPAQLELGTLFPGASKAPQLRFDGIFPETDATLGLHGRDSVPSCVHLRLGDAEEGETLRVLREQPYLLEIRVDASCDEISGQTVAVDAAVELRFPPEAGIPTVKIPLRFQLDAGADLGETLSFEVEAGGTDDGGVALTAGRTYKARLVMNAPGRWQDEDLEWAFVDPVDPKELVRDNAGRPEQAYSFTYQEGQPLRLRVRAGRCCSGGGFDGRLILEPQAGGRALQIPMVVTVGANFWRCWRPRLLTALVFLVVFLLSMYVGNMFRHTSLLKPDQLASRLVPLRWNAFGGVEEHLKAQRDVDDMVKSGLSRGRRLAAWLRANPLIFGLPDRTYEETVELYLEPHRDIGRSSLSLLGERGVHARLEHDPESATGKLFASARDGSTGFYAVPGRGHRVGRLVPQRFSDVSDLDETPQAKVMKLRRKEKLVYPASENEKEEGQVAGWRVG